MIGAVRVGNKAGFIKPKFALLIKQFLIDMNTEYFSEKHIVGSERDHLGHAALNIDRTLQNQRAGNLIRLRGGQLAALKLVNVLA